MFNTVIASPILGDHMGAAPLSFADAKVKLTLAKHCGRSPIKTLVERTAHRTAKQKLCSGVRLLKPSSPPPMASGVDRSVANLDSIFRIIFGSRSPQISVKTFWRDSWIFLLSPERMTCLCFLFLTPTLLKKIDSHLDLPSSRHPAALLPDQSVSFVVGPVSRRVVRVIYF